MRMSDVLYLRQNNIPLTNIELDIIANKSIRLTQEEIVRLAHYRDSLPEVEWVFGSISENNLSNLEVLLYFREENTPFIIDMFGNIFKDIVIIPTNIPVVSQTLEFVTNVLCNSLVANSLSPMEAVDLLFDTMRRMSILETIFSYHVLDIEAILRPIYGIEKTEEIIQRIKEDVELYILDNE